MCVDCVLCCVLQDGVTPLRLAAVNNKMDAVRVLLEHGADVAVKGNVSSEGREGRGGGGVWG